VAINSLAGVGSVATFPSALVAHDADIVHNPTCLPPAHLGLSMPGPRRRAAIPGLGPVPERLSAPWVAARASRATTAPRAGSAAGTIRTQVDPVDPVVVGE
jgi:hypothetical protein